MPDNNPQQLKKDPQVDRFVKTNPQYQDFFENYPVPDNPAAKDVNLGSAEDYLNSQDVYLKDKARLNAYAQTLNQELEKKNPKLYGELMSKYSWDDKHPSSGKTRTTGAESYAKSDPNFNLSPTEQKKILGENWEDYSNLRGAYGKNLNLVGEKEDASKPETWTVGARHSVAFNPASSSYINEPTESNKQVRSTSKYKKTLEYNTGSKEYTGNTMYSNINKDDPSKNINDLYVRRLSEVKANYDPNTQVKTDQGVVFKKPGWHFYKTYDDGSKDEVSENEYQTLKKFNTLDPSIKNKYIETVDPSKLKGKNKEIAANKMELLKTVENDN